MAELERLLRSKAVLLPGVRVTLTLEKTGETRQWQYDEGLRGYLQEELAQEPGGEPLVLFEDQQYAGRGDDSLAEGEGAH